MSKKERSDWVSSKVEDSAKILSEKIMESSNKIKELFESHDHNNDFLDRGTFSNIKTREIGSYIEKVTNSWDN